MAVSRGPMHTSSGRTLPADYGLSRSLTFLLISRCSDGDCVELLAGVLGDDKPHAHGHRSHENRYG